MTQAAELAHKLAGRLRSTMPTAHVTHRQRRRHHPEDCRLFLSNLSYEASELDVLGLVRRLGVEPIRINLGKPVNGRPPGFAFLDYRTPADVASARAALAGQVLMGRPLRAGLPSRLSSVPGQP